MPAGNPVGMRAKGCCTFSRTFSTSMYIIAIAWLYVVLLIAVADSSVVGGILTFVFGGLAPLALFLWLVGTPARRRGRRRADPPGGGEDDRRP